MKILEAMPHWNVRKKRRIASYPWDEWFDGQIRFAEVGVDFETSVEAFATCLRHAAKCRLYTLESRMTYSGVAFRAEKIPGA